MIYYLLHTYIFEEIFYDDHIYIDLFILNC